MMTLRNAVSGALDQLAARDKVQAALALTVTLAVVILFVARDSVPPELLGVWTLIVGYYFGTRSNGNGADKGGV